MLLDKTRQTAYPPQVPGNTFGQSNLEVAGVELAAMCVPNHSPLGDASDGTIITTLGTYQF